MKRFSKLKTKKGFTLLETLLATCILVIIGSMLMEGFITAMGYSYNSSVYSKSAAYNSQLCVKQIADWSVKADVETPTTTAENPYRAVGEYVISNGQFTNKAMINFNTLGAVNVAVYEQKQVNCSSDKNLTTFTAEKIRNNVNAVADNRTILFYYPSYIGTTPTESFFGNTHVYLVNGTTYKWGYDDPSATNGVVLKQDRTKSTPTQ